MPLATRRPLGTMVAYGFPKSDLGIDLEIARRLGATCIEVLPDWRSLPDPTTVRERAEEQALTIHSAHGCWGGQAIRAARVELADPDPATRTASREDLKRAIDWLAVAGGRCLVVHPGGLSEPEAFEERRAV